MRIKYLHKQPLQAHVKKIYLSREQTRSWSMFEPIGDPDCSVYNDPISATLAVTSMAGTYAAAGSFAAMSFAQGMIFAGSALNLAGNITGNKSLMKIGAGVALVGGITMGVQALAEGTFGGGPIGDGATDLTGSSNVAQSTTGQVGNQAQTYADATLNTPLNMSQGTQVASIGDAGGLGNMNVATNQTAQNMTMADKVLAAQKNIPANIPKGEVFQYQKGSGFMDYINKHPGVAMVGASTIGPALGSVADYASGKTQAEMDMMKADAEYKRAVAKAKEEELAQQEINRQRLNDPNRFNYARGIINRNRTTEI